MFTLYCLVDDNTSDTATFRAEHGVAFAIQTPNGQVLFDTGQSGDVLAHNARQMGLDLGQIVALAISHAHNDHTGGMETFLRHHSRPDVPVYAHPDLLRERFAVKDGQTRSIGLRMTHTDLTQFAILHWNAVPVEILPRIWTSGEITDRAEFEGRSPHHFIRAADGGWLPDPYRDDMALILETPGGLVVVCGCCHSGLVNTLAHMQRVFRQPVRAVVGGAHLASVSDAMLERAIAVLGVANNGRAPDLYLNHCTGEHALSILARVFGEKVHPCPAGTVMQFM